VLPLAATGAINWEKWTAIGTLALAGATVLALLAAPLRRWIVRARLTMEIRTRPPDMHKILMTTRPPEASSRYTIYMRIRVVHKRGAPAENAEIMTTSLRRLAGRESEVVTTFLPLNLAWSNSLSPTSTLRIPHGGFRFCDLGHFVRSTTGETVLYLDPIFKPNPVEESGIPPYAIPAGDYEIELVLAADNTRPQTCRWQIQFGPEWSEVQSEMLERIAVTPVRRRRRFADSFGRLARRLARRHDDRHG
jgi:hypothetical protein